MLGCSLNSLRCLQCVCFLQPEVRFASWLLTEHGAAFRGAGQTPCSCHHSRIVCGDSRCRFWRGTPCLSMRWGLARISTLGSMAELFKGHVSWEVRLEDSNRLRSQVCIRLCLGIPVPSRSCLQAYLPSHIQWKAPHWWAHFPCSKPESLRCLQIKTKMLVLMKMIRNKNIHILIVNVWKCKSHMIIEIKR